MNVNGDSCMLQRCRMAIEVLPFYQRIFSRLYVRNLMFQRLKIYWQALNLIQKLYLRKVYGTNSLERFICRKSGYSCVRCIVTMIIFHFSERRANTARTRLVG